MDDLISRQAAITLPVMQKEHREYQTFNLDDAYEQGWNDLQKCIESLPSARPEIVRCKDCKNWEKVLPDIGICQNINQGVMAWWLGDDYCSRAERREG